MLKGRCCQDLMTTYFPIPPLTNETGNIGSLHYNKSDEFLFTIIYDTRYIHIQGFTS